MLTDNKSLASCTRAYLEADRWRHFWLVDVRLRAYTVKSVKTLGRAGLFGWRPGFKGTYLNIDLEFYEEQQTLFQAKEHIQSWLRRHPQAYESGSLDGDGLQEALACAKSGQQLVATLA